LGSGVERTQNKKEERQPTTAANSEKKLLGQRMQGGVGPAPNNALAKGKGLG